MSERSASKYLLYRLDGLRPHFTEAMVKEIEEQKTLYGVPVVEYTNPAQLAMDYVSESIMGKTIDIVAHPDDQEDLNDRITKLRDRPVTEGFMLKEIYDEMSAEQLKQLSGTYSLKVFDMLEELADYFVDNEARGPVFIPYEYKQRLQKLFDERGRGDIDIADLPS